jgi:hypothetical protein
MTVSCCGSWQPSWEQQPSCLRRSNLVPTDLSRHASNLLLHVLPASRLLLHRRRLQRHLLINLRELATSWERHRRPLPKIPYRQKRILHLCRHIIRNQPMVSPRLRKHIHLFSCELSNLPVFNHRGFAMSLLHHLARLPRNRRSIHFP